MIRILSFGEILFDIIEGEHYLGGAPLNFAAHLAQMGEASYIFSRVGKDELGQEALNKIKQIGLKSDFIQQDGQYPTGTVPVAFKNGQPDYTILKDVAYDFIDFLESEIALHAQDFDVLYYGTLAQRNRASQKALQELVNNKTFKHIFYDINLRKDCYTPSIIQHSLQHCTIFKLNDEEITIVSNLLYGKEFTMEEFVGLISKDYQIGVIVITAGASGCYVYAHEDLHFVKGYPAQVMDTVGAGDAFSAAFVREYVTHNDLLRAGEIANQLGAFVAASRGPIPDYSPEITKVLGLSKTEKLA